MLKLNSRTVVQEIAIETATSEANVQPAQRRSTMVTIIAPTAEEDRLITAAALAAPDALPLTDAQLRLMRPARASSK